MQAQGSRAYLAIQEEGVFATDPTVAAMTKFFFDSESISKSLALVDSNVIRATRNPVSPVRGNVDVGGSFSSDLSAYPAELLYGVLGSSATAANSGSGETLGTAMTTPAGVIDAVNQTLTITATTHGVDVGDVVQIAGLTAPTSLNSKYFRVVKKTSADVFVVRIPTGTSTTWTLGSGTVKKVTANATTYLHTLKVGTALPSFVIEKGFDDIDQFFKYNGCKFSRFNLAVESSGFQKISFDLLGAKETAGSSPFDSALTEQSFMPFDGFMISTIEEGGSPIANVTKASLSVENMLDGDTFVVGGAGIRGAINEGVVKVSGTITALFENLTLYNKAVNSTESSLRVVYTRGTGAGTAGNEKLEFKVPELIYSVKTPPITGPRGILVELPFSAFYDNSAEATAIQALVYNSQAAL